MTSFTANASGEHTISVGFAQSDVKMEEGERLLGKDPRGLNLKYRYEVNDHWGVIGSFTLTRVDETLYLGNIAKLNQEITYRSWMAGPAYRFNEYVSTYALIGAAKMSDFRTGSGFGTYSLHNEEKTAVAYGAGLQFNPISNVAVDVTYEYSGLDNAKVGTFVVGVGYRF
ncbi:Attachment invasion locus protein [Xenorhabdus poinarii G6]|uniref:Attachment invasion locus protein n=2 Tax=Xenorhabdus poinarii TaxID=40577 RepID=A0A068R3N7_9GAMM|nr:Attachment invasion locus protein [Xenorhabdus poinarii G6]